jgi:hypothetical protein
MTDGPVPSGPIGASTLAREVNRVPGMPQPRRSAWVLVTTLVATFVFGTMPAYALDPLQDPAIQDDSMCNAGPTHWGDELHPPDTVRVLRSRGPTKGKVDVVPLWKYVGRVLRAEYSSGSSKPYPWMHVGALTVKEYAWYYAMHWRGGKIPIYDTAEPPNIVGYDCYDLKDTTADQIYTDQKPDPNNPGQWIPANVPSAANLEAMRESWHLTIRKWQTTKNKSRLFLTGYRSGKQKPCGTDSTGFKIYQKSLRDCGAKGLTLEETLRKYFEPNLLIVDTRLNDVVDDSGGYKGDLGVLYASGGNTGWKLYEGTASSFTSGASGTFTVDPAKVLGQGVGNVDFGSNSATDTGPNDSKVLADLLMLVDTGSGRAVKVARATGGAGALGSLASFDAPAGAQRLLVADFNGDLTEDAGVLVDLGGGQAALKVMKSKGDGTLLAAADWWTGPLDLSADGVFVAAGDVNGDEKADLIMRDATTGVLSAATSRASCNPIGPWASSCAPENVGAPGLVAATPWLSTFNAAASNVKMVVGDYDRDGRDDVIAVVKNATGAAFKVLGIRAKTDGTFADPQQLWDSGTMAFADVTPTAMNVNSDGMADLAMLVNQSGTTKVQWLRTVERSAVPASMVSAGEAINAGITWGPGNRLF